MNLYSLLYPSERKACKDADIMNCHFHDITIQELSTIGYKKLIDFENTESLYFLSNASKVLCELQCRSSRYSFDNTYFSLEPKTTKEGL